VTRSSDYSGHRETTTSAVKNELVDNITACLLRIADKSAIVQFGLYAFSKGDWLLQLKRLSALWSFDKGH
jgi:hypothetical protein